MNNDKKMAGGGLLIALGVGSIALAIVELFFGVPRILGGRWGWLDHWMLSVLGSHGPSLFSGLGGLALIVMGLNARKPH